MTWTAIGFSVFRAWAELSLVGCFHGLFGQPKLRIKGPNHRHIVANGAVRQQRDAAEQHHSEPSAGAEHSKAHLVQEAHSITQ